MFVARSWVGFWGKNVKGARSVHVYSKGEMAAVLSIKGVFLSNIYHRMESGFPRKAAWV